MDRTPRPSAQWPNGGYEIPHSPHAGGNNWTLDTPDFPLPLVGRLNIPWAGGPGPGAKPGGGGAAPGKQIWKEILTSRTPAHRLCPAHRPAPAQPGPGEGWRAASRARAPGPRPKGCANKIRSGAPAPAPRARPSRGGSGGRAGPVGRGPGGSGSSGGPFRPPRGLKWGPEVGNAGPIPTSALCPSIHPLPVQSPASPSPQRPSSLPSPPDLMWVCGGLMWVCSNS